MDRLAGFELLPFQKALDEKADALMVAHIVLTSLDPDFPASLSSAVISGLLRNEMGFEGVVITDDMTMGAITENFDTGEAAVRSVNAGCDIILVCNGYDRQLETMDAVKQAVETGLISESRIDESVVRILKLKDKYDLSDNIVGHADVEGLNEKIEGVLSKWYNDN
jgi:beta-N-acetylhexosaminidase